jgi:hypothetical protein
MDDHWRILDEVKRLTGGRWCERTIEAPSACSGRSTSPASSPASAAASSSRATTRTELRQVNMQLWNWRGIDVINAHERDPRVRAGHPRSRRHDGGGRARPGTALHPPLPLDRLGEALELTRTRPDGFLKAVVTTEGGVTMNVNA